jgi:hypothetical protein
MRLRHSVFRLLVALILTGFGSHDPAFAATLVFVQPPAAEPQRATGVCSKPQQDAIVGAYALAQQKLAVVIDAMKTGSAPAVSLFDTYFGAANRLNYDLVRNNLTMTLNAMAATNRDRIAVYCDLSDARGEPCADFVSAAWLIDEPLTARQTRAANAVEAVVVCKPFFFASRRDGRTRWGTMLHEMTHIVFASVDDKYRNEEVRHLAGTATALVNAESYRQFAEAVAAPSDLSAAGR